MNFLVYSQDILKILSLAGFASRTGARNAASLGFCAKGGWKIWRSVALLLDP